MLQKPRDCYRGRGGGGWDPPPPAPQCIQYIVATQIVSISHLFYLLSYSPRRKLSQSLSLASMPVFGKGGINRKQASSIKKLP